MTCRLELLATSGRHVDSFVARFRTRATFKNQSGYACRNKISHTRVCQQRFKQREPVCQIGDHSKLFIIDCDYMGGTHVISDEPHARLHEENPQLRVPTKTPTPMRSGEKFLGRG